jgi:hypothetical protein
MYGREMGLPRKIAGMKFVKITTEQVVDARQVVAEDDAEALIELMRLATDQAAGLRNPGTES